MVAASASSPSASRAVAREALCDARTRETAACSSGKNQPVALGRGGTGAVEGPGSAMKKFVTQKGHSAGQQEKAALGRAAAAMLALLALPLGLQTTIRLTQEERASFLQQFSFGGFAAASYFKQKLDHFVAEDGRTFDQRYFEQRNYWAGAQASPDPPVFLYLGGEAPLYGLPSGWVEELSLIHI